MIPIQWIMRGSLYEKCLEILVVNPLALSRPISKNLPTIFTSKISSKTIC